MSCSMQRMGVRGRQGGKEGDREGGREVGDHLKARGSNKGAEKQSCSLRLQDLQDGTEDGSSCDGSRVRLV